MAPDEDLLKAAVAVLKADATITALCGSRIYDRVPEKTARSPDVAYPYISIGPTSEIPADVDCIDGVEITIQFDIWSSGETAAYGSTECRTIREAVRRALNEAELALTDNSLVHLTYVLGRTLREPDGITSHAVVQFTATIEVP